MANNGIPLGGQFPSRSVASSIFSDLLGDAASELGVDRRTLFGKQSERIFNDSLTEADTAGGFTNAGKFFSPDAWSSADIQTSDVDGATYAGDTAFNQDVAKWDVPTSSTNYSRPRTVAAAYAPNKDEPRKGIMTVVFRDGTFYNYYDVSPTEWEAFHASFSKGKPWLNKANSNQASDGLFINKPRGIADPSSIPAEVREALYRVARTHQQKRPPKPGRTYQQAPLAGGGSMSVLNNPRSNKSRVKNANPKPRQVSSKGNRKAS